MPTTRSTARGHGDASDAPAQAAPKSAGTKRKAEGTPEKASKRGKAAKKEQKTIDDTMDLDKPEAEPKHERPDPQDTNVDYDEEAAKTEEKAEHEDGGKGNEGPAERQPDESSKNSNGYTNGDAKAKENAQEQKSKAKPETEKPSADEEAEMIKASEEAAAKKADKRTDDKTAAKSADKADGKPDDASTSNPSLNGNVEEVNAAIEKGLEKAEPEKAVEQDPARAEAEPSNILEKGIVYFFIRGRVGIDDPKSIEDIQRTYFVLRPIPSGGKLAESAPIGDAGKNRMIALPKKVFPASRRDTFLCIVESADSSFEAIRNEHLKHSDYETKTLGTRHTPAAKPIAEGIYALTTTGRESHLSYIITVPGELGQLQRDIGLTSRGAFVTSVRNPGAGAPPGAAPPQQAEYPEGIKNDFRGLRWGRLEPAHLDYVNTQFLLIGEGEQDKLEKSVQADTGDGQQDGKEEPLEEMELLEAEDRERINGMSGGDSDAIFQDLGLSKDEYAKIQTKWE